MQSLYLLNHLGYFYLCICLCIIYCPAKGEGKIKPYKNKYVINTFKMKWESQ